VASLERAEFIFLIASSPAGRGPHLKVLAVIAKFLRDDYVWVQASDFACRASSATIENEDKYLFIHW